MKIGIGTPRQYFDLIADTGSSAVIVTHCACQKTNCFGHLGMLSVKELGVGSKNFEKAATSCFVWLSR